MSLFVKRDELSFAGYPATGRGRLRVLDGANDTVVYAAGAVAAVLLAAMIAVAGPLLTLLFMILLTLLGIMMLRPAVASYLLIGITPLVAGIDRGTVMPALRPNEALMVLAVAALWGRAILRLNVSSRPTFRFERLDVAILALAVTSSFVPLAWLGLRGKTFESDDILYSLMIWKYYAVFLIFRSTIRSPAQARICLWLSMAAASVVAVIAVFQSLGFPGVEAFLTKYYTSYGVTAAIANNRGGSTLSLPIAVADLMAFNLAIAVGLLRSSRRRWPLIAFICLFAIGIFASGQFSGAIGLVVAVCAIAITTGRIRYLAVLPASLAVALVALKPVINKRLEGFQSPSGLPVSWQGRLNNLHNYFLPELFSHTHWVLGVRPAARVATQARAAGYIWIESGYIWLLWAGGIPLLLSFFYFLWAGGREAVAVLRTRTDAPSAAALAVIVALSVVGVLMAIDPHVTYRGSADLLFALLGIVAAAKAMPSDEPRAG
jgi:hypothetical protein